MTSPRARMQARLITVSSSPTLPGQSCSCSIRATVSSTPRIVRFRSALNRWMRWRTSSGMSWRRSRSGGRLSVMTASAWYSSRLNAPDATRPLSSGRLRRSARLRPRGRGRETARVLAQRARQARLKRQGSASAAAGCRAGRVLEQLGLERRFLHRARLRQTDGHDAGCYRGSSRSPAPVPCSPRPAGRRGDQPTDDL